MAENGKPKVAFFDFACCEGCQLTVVDALQTHLELVEAVEIVQFREAMTEKGEDYLIAFIEGSCTRKEDEARLRDIREKAAMTFFEPHHASDTLVDELGEITGNRARALRLVKMARSAKEEILADRLGEIRVPTLLVWGREDGITPPDVAEQFHRGIAGSELHWVSHCGHVPMMEQPDRFNSVLADFLDRTFPPGSPSTDRA